MFRNFFDFFVNMGLWLLAWGVAVFGVLILLVLGWDRLNRPSGLPLIPSTEEALEESLKRIGNPSLTRVFHARRSACFIEGGPILGWKVDCPDIQRTRTSPGAWCRSVSWNIDVWGRPSDGFGANRYLSGEDRCRTEDESRPSE